MDIKINGKQHALPGDMAPLSAVLEYAGVDIQQTGIAVAVNLQVVPRGEWPRWMVEKGDEIEVITARQGG
jgi:sulfur carrier protein